MAEAQHSNQQPAESRRSVVLSNYRNQSIELDPSIIIDITIHESLNQNTTHGEITILDIGGFEERIPIIGQEKINIKFGSSHLTNVPIQDKNFVIYNMSPKLIDESRKQAYVLFFVSEEYIANLKYKVSRSYKDFGYEIVKDIYFDYIQNNVTHQKSLYGVDNTDVDSTAYEMQLVMGMFRPFESINLVAKKSVSARGSFIGSKYMFFENKDGFHFKSIDSLISPKSSTKDLEQEEDNSTLKKFQQAKQIELENNPVADKFILMPANATSENNTFDLPSEESIIRSFKFESTFDVIANIVGGMYNSRLLTYDPITMRVGALDNEGAYASMKDTEKATRKSSVRQKFYDYDYLQRFNQFSHVFGIANPMITKSHFAYGSPESSYKYVTTNFERDARKQVKILSKDMGKEVNYEINSERWLLPNMARNRQLKNIVLSVSVPGNHTRTVGDLVHIDLPSSHFAGEKHRYYAGNYLITELSHKITGDSYYMDMKLVKDNLSEKLKEFEDIYGVTDQEMLDAGAEQSFLDALVADNNVWDEDEAGEE
tara:strand:+ start:80 stop:1705 length:1626 start_codon:yes stop_codon:yes gene_type:complete